MNSQQAQKAVHEALKGYCEEGELVVNWVATMEIVMPNGNRYLGFRSGGGFDGTESPMAWAALGMLQASANLAGAQTLSQCVEPNDEEDDEDAGEA